MMVQKWILGNWKMNGTVSHIQALLDTLKKGSIPPEVMCAVFPPFVYCAWVNTLLTGTGIRIGAQDVSAHASGAYTGEVSAAMLKELGCQYALVGHSERRQYHHETDAIVVEKWQAAQRDGITPVLCIGETLSEREAGQTMHVVTQQLNAVLSVLQDEDCFFIVAYEPVWAIGTGKTATSEQVAAVHAQLRAQCALRSEKLAKNTKILYGGSVKPDNARMLLHLPNVDGALVGGASWVAKDFLAIIRAATMSDDR